MGIQLNGSNDNISAVDGDLSITGISTFSQLDVGNNIKFGNAGVVTATSYRGDGSQLTGISAGVSVANQADDRLITATGTSNALNAESSLTYNSGGLVINSGDLYLTDSIIHGGNTPTKIRFPSVNTISMETNGSERLRIASNGQVSISNDGTTDGLLTIKGDSDQVATPSIRLLDGSDTREVSISNTSGDFVVSVHGNDNAIHGHIKMFESGIFDINNGGASGNNTNRLRIKTNGNVGLGGETNPITTLSINRGDTGANTSFLNAELIRIDGYGSTNSKSGIGFGRYNSGQNGSIPAAFIGAQTGTWSSSTNCHLIFATRDSTGNVEPTERLRITSDGNVVVGGSSLGASGSFGMEPNGHVRSVLASGNAGDSLLGAISGVSNGFQINIDSSNNQTYKFHNGSTLSMQIDSGGRVTTPLRPAWHAWGANSWTSYSGSNNLVTFAYSDTNIGSHYKTSGSDAGKFVCPVAGVYFFYCTIYSGRSDNSTSDGSDYMAINFFSSTNNLANKGGHHIAHYYNEGDRDSTRTLSYVKYCSAGEKLYVTVSCNGTSFQIYGGHSAFGGYLLG